jgi:hypothetical protein
VARPLLIEAEKRLKERKIETPGGAIARVVFPGIGKALLAPARLERKLEALRIVEALRLHAATAGHLPNKLDDLAVPVPLDPLTGRPFTYNREGETATLSSQIPDDPIATTGLRFRITLRK